MTAQKDQAVCLRTHRYSESSQIVTFFGRRCGKVRAVAKGARRPKSGSPNTLEVLALTDIVFYPGRGESGLASLGSADLIDPMSSLRKRLPNLYVGQLMADLVDQFTEDLDPHEILFEELTDTLGRLGRSERPDTLLLHFELALLEQVGLTPTWNNCNACGTALPRGQQRYYFSSRQSGMLCRDCEPAEADKRFIDFPTWSLLQAPDTAGNAPGKIVFAALELLYYHQRELLGKETKTMKFVHGMLKPLKGTEGLSN